MKIREFAAGLGVAAACAGVVAPVVVSTVTAAAPAAVAMSYSSHPDMSYS